MTRSSDSPESDAVSGPVLGREDWILVVDDDRDSAAITERCLQRAEFAGEVVVCYAAADALRVLGQRERIPGLMLVDLNMPCMDGCELLLRMRQEPRYDGIQKVMLTSSDNPADRRRAHECGAHAFVTKFPALATFAQLLRLGLRVTGSSSPFSRRGTDTSC